jgi:hypothetical protein
LIRDWSKLQLSFIRFFGDGVVGPSIGPAATSTATSVHIHIAGSVTFYYNVAITVL